MISTKEKNTLPYIIAIACFLVLFILMKVQDVRTEEARTNKEPAKEAIQKREAASARAVETKKSKN